MADLADNYCRAGTKPGTAAAADGDTVKKRLINSSALAPSDKACRLRSMESGRRFLRHTETPATQAKPGFG